MTPPPTQQKITQMYEQASEEGATDGPWRKSHTSTDNMQFVSWKNEANPQHRHLYRRWVSDSGQCTKWEPVIATAVPWLV